MKIKTEITLLDYYNSEDKSEVNLYLRSAKLNPADILKFGSLYNNGSFQFVKDIQMLCNSCLGDLDGFLLVLKEMLNSITEEKDIDLKKIYKYSIFHIYQQFLFFHEEIHKVSSYDNEGNLINSAGINELEINGLGGSVSDEDKMAGIDVFAKYGSFILLDKLTDGKLEMHDIYKKMPYSRCFTKLLLDKDRNDFERRKIDNKK